MPIEINQITVFVSCPSDVEDEKNIIRDICKDITNTLSKTKNIQIKPLDWKNDVIPLITGKDAQSVIDKQIADYDIYIGILWKRFGDKRLNGLTPTEGEFEDALKRMKETGRPVITIYFKTKEFYPQNSYESGQICEVTKFKERIRDLNIGIYDEFNEGIEFRKKVYNSLSYIVENFPTLTSKKIVISNLKYPDISNYLRRNVFPADEYAPDTLFLKNELSQDSLDIVKLHNRVVLLSDAGVGKTIELKRIASYFSKDNSPFYPFFQALNKYVNQNLSEFLPQNLRSIPENQLLIILDGLDEIETVNKNNAIRQIELFAEQHPNTHIVVSCRTNFYNLKTKQSSGTLSGFSSYVLLGLDRADIEKYIKTKLGQRERNFIELIYKNQLHELLKIPFYLIHLIELFESKGKLPQNKAEIFEQLLFARINLDKEHFKTTIELEEEQKRIIETLERIALGMEILGRNYVTNDEFEKLIPDNSLRILLKYCTTWKRNEGERVTWQFEHNNFQEYLAASNLSRQSLDIIKDFISFKPDNRKIIPSWVNTLSFLVSISNEHDLIQWIMDIEPELVVKFEPDKIEKAERIHIFKEIFNKYKLKKIWINHDKFSYSELARFGQSEEIVDFLLTEAETPSHYTTLSNAVGLLSTIKIPFNERKRASQLLVKCALDGGKAETIQNKALYALTELNLNSIEVVNEIVPKLRPSDNDQVRYGFYNFLYNSEYLDENIDVFLEGIKYVRFKSSIKNGKSRLVNEVVELVRGLERAKSPEAIRKIVTYFKGNPKDLYDLHFRENLSNVAENASNAFSKDPSLLEAIIDFFIVLVTEHLEEETKNFNSFFDKTSTRLQSFQKVFSQKNSNKDWVIILATLADTKCIEFLIKEYEKHNITDDDIWAFQTYLNWKNKDLYLKFYKLINGVSGNKFIIPQQRDFDTERKQRKQRDINLIFDKQEFLKELKLIYDIEQKQTFKREELQNIMTHRWNKPNFSYIVIHTLREIAGDKTVSLEMTTQVINKWDWDWFCISKIYEFVGRDKEVALSREQQEWIANWCNSNLNKVNFKTAIVTKPDKEFSASWLAIYLWYFLRNFNLTYPKNVLLDMLSFDWVENGQMIGIGYLEERLDEINITIRILENLQDGIQNNDVLKNHIEYCQKHNIKDVLPYALAVIADAERNIEVRQIAMETVCEISVSALEQILQNITDDFKWIVENKLVKYNSKNNHTYLLGILATGNKEEQFKAAEYLIELQDLEGLKYYVEWIKRNKKFPGKMFGGHPLLSLQSLESVPLLIELLKLSYQDDIIKDDFHRLDTIVLDTLTAIGLKSEKNYNEIKEDIETFIKISSSKIKNVNFLYIFLEKLEQKYYVIKSEKLNITDAVKKLEKML